MVESFTEEEAFWPFRLTDEPVDTSGVFGSVGGVSEEETFDLLYIAEEEPLPPQGFRVYIVGG